LQALRGAYPRLLEFEDFVHEREGKIDTMVHVKRGGTTDGECGIAAGFAAYGFKPGSHEGKIMGQKVPQPPQPQPQPQPQW
jgi:hypothetical protein